MNRVIDIRIIEDYLVWLKFEDGFSSQLDLKPFLGKGMTEELLEKDKFKTLGLEDGGGIAFYNGYDFCPNYLRMLTDKKENANKV